MSIVSKLKDIGFDGADIHWFFVKHDIHEIPIGIMTDADLRLQKKKHEWAEAAIMYEIPKFK